MSDLISRKEAIDALEREKTYCMAYRDGYSPIDVFEKYNAGLTDGIKALENLPSAHPEQRWIPCSERLPEDVEIGEEYPTIIFCDSDGIVYVGFCEYTIYGNKFWNNTDWNDVVDNVIAWMPLPEPWKGEAE